MLDLKIEETKAIPYDLLLLADEAKEAIDRYIFDSTIFVLKDGPIIVGVYALLLIDNGIVEIKNIAIKENRQGKGLGTLLLNDATKRCRSNGMLELRIGTGNASISQLYLYQKTGFEIFDIKWNFFLDNYPEPIFENGILLKHMIMLKKVL